MKKKIKDLTLGELANYCKKHQCNNTCMLKKVCEDFDEKDLEREVEVDE